MESFNFPNSSIPNFSLPKNSIQPSGEIKRMNSDSDSDREHRLANLAVRLKKFKDPKLCSRLIQSQARRVQITNEDKTRVYTTDKFSMMWCCQKGFFEFMEEKKWSAKVIFQHIFENGKIFIKFESMSQELTTILGVGACGGNLTMSQFDKKRKKKTHTGMLFHETEYKCPSKFLKKKNISEKDSHVCSELCDSVKLTIASKIMCLYAMCGQCKEYQNSNLHNCLGTCSCQNTEKTFQETLKTLSMAKEMGIDFDSVYVRTVIKQGLNDIDIPEFLKIENCASEILKYYHSLKYFINMENEKEIENPKLVNYLDLKISPKAKLGFKNGKNMPNFLEEQNTLSYTTLKLLKPFEDSFVILTVYSYGKENRPGIMEPKISRYFYFIKNITETEDSYNIRFNTQNAVFVSVKNAYKITLSVCKYKSDVQIETLLPENKGFMTKDFYNRLIQEEWPIINIDDKQVSLKLLTLIYSNLIPDVLVVPDMVLHVPKGECYRLNYFIKADKINYGAFYVHRIFKTLLDLKLFEAGGEKDQKKIIGIIMMYVVKMKVLKK